VRFRAGWIALAACLFALPACGGSEEPARPQLAPVVAAELAARNEAIADALARGDTCAADAEAARLQQAVVAAVNAGRVPPELQEEVTGAANGLAERIACEPPAPAPAPARADGEDDEGGNGQGKDTGKKGGD
jgi:hypothetical protein